MGARLALALALTASLPACGAAGTAALTIGSEILVKGFEIDTAIINNIKARKDAKADPNVGTAAPERELGR